MIVDPVASLKVFDITDATALTKICNDILALPVEKDQAINSFANKILEAIPKENDSEKCLNFLSMITPINLDEKGSSNLYRALIKILELMDLNDSEKARSCQAQLAFFIRHAWQNYKAKLCAEDVQLVQEEVPFPIENTLEEVPSPIENTLSDIRRLIVSSVDIPEIGRFGSTCKNLNEETKFVLTEKINAKEVVAPKMSYERTLNYYEGIETFVKVLLLGNDWSISNSEWTDEQLEKLVAKFPNLEKLTIAADSKITEKGLASLSKLKSLKEFKFVNATQRELVEILKLEQLRVLDITNCDGGESFSLKFSNLKNLEVLIMDYSQISTNPLAENIPSLPLLKTLSLKECSFNFSETKKEVLENLEELDLSNLHITDVGLEFLKQCKKLKKLNLNNSERLFDDELKSLENLLNLESLSLSSNLITDAGFQYLDNLLSLRSLDISWVERITKEGLIKFINTLSSLEKNALKIDKDTESPKLKKLNLSGLDVTDLTIKELEKLEHLEKLQLFCCGQITDEGLESLVKLKKLKTLNISYCREITLQSLKQISQMETLQKLIMYKCNVSWEDVQTLKRPGLEIIYHNEYDETSTYPYTLKY